MNIVKKQQSGFTLIELVMVIVILGILAATAMPKFIDLKGQATLAAVQGVAGALGSASAMNKASRTINASSGSAALNCTVFGTLLEGGSVPTGYTITSTTLTNGEVGTCTVSSGSQSATFVGLGIS